MNFITVFLISLGLFFIGLFGIFVNRKNLLTVIICLELILLSINFNLLISAFYLDDVLGEIFVIIILTVAAAESSIGLAVLIIYYRLRGTIAIEFINSLKG
jgi:NADH-quinone oxidoreductase subunit K